MTNKVCWIIIIISLMINVVMLQLTIHNYYGLDYERVIIYSAIAVVSALIATFTFISWLKNVKSEYNTKK